MPPSSTVSPPTAGADSVTVKVTVFEPPLPSVTLTSAIDAARAASSLRIVTVADAGEPSDRPPVGFDSVTTNVSSASTVLSPSTVTLNVALVAPAPNVTVPDAAV